MKKIASGVPGLDHLLHGGIPFSKTVLVAGTCGTGKTILASQFLKKGYELGEKSVFVTLEQSKQKLVEDMDSVGIPLEEMFRRKKLVLIGGPIGNVNFFKQETKASVRDLVQEIMEVVKQGGASRVVIDSINLFTMLFESESERRQAMALLVSQLEELDCTTIMTSEVPEANGKYGWFGFEEFVVDGVIKLSRDIVNNECIRTIAIVKMRGSDIQADVRAMSLTQRGVIVHHDKIPSGETIF